MPADDSSNRRSPVKLGSGLKRIKSDSDDSEIRGKQASRNARLFSFPERRNKLVRTWALQARLKGKETEIHTAIHMLPRREGNENQSHSIQIGISRKMNVIHIENR